MAVLRGEDEPYAEQEVDGRTYAVVSPGETYHVKVTVHPDNRGRFRYKHLRFGLYVDGQDVQYWKRLDLSKATSDNQATVRFWGFKQNVNDIRSFVFSSVKSSSSDSTPSSALGRLKVVVFEAQIVSGAINNLVAARNISSQHLVPEGTKFFKQASVMTALGDRINSSKEVFVPNLSKWENLGTVPLATIELFYHTAETLHVLREASMSGDQDESAAGRVAKKPRRENEQSDSQPVGGDNGEEAEDVVVVRRERIVPMLDLTKEGNPTWESIVIER